SRDLPRNALDPRLSTNIAFPEEESPVESLLWGAMDVLTAANHEFAQELHAPRKDMVQKFLPVQNPAKILCPVTRIRWPLNRHVRCGTFHKYHPGDIEIGIGHTDQLIQQRGPFFLI